MKLFLVSLMVVSLVLACWCISVSCLISQCEFTAKIVELCSSSSPVLAPRHCHSQDNMFNKERDLRGQIIIYNFKTCHMKIIYPGLGTLLAKFETKFSYFKTTLIFKGLSKVIKHKN